MADWRHRAKGVAVLAAFLAVLGLVALRNPGAVHVGVLGFILFGVLAMLVGLAVLVLTRVGDG